MKSISPLIATILLIVMTVGIAGLMYVWMSNTFNTLTQQSSQQISGMTQTVNFILSQGTINNSYIAFTFYNAPSSTIPIDLSKCIYTLIVQPPTGTPSQYNVNAPTGITVNPGESKRVTLSNPAETTNTANRYSLSVSCYGVPNSITLTVVS